MLNLFAETMDVRAEAELQDVRGVSLVLLR